MVRPVDHKSFTPKHVQVADDLRERIAAGEYPQGALLPSGAVLADLYEVSVPTIRRALTALGAEHLITAEQGVRAEVREMGERAVEQLKPGEEAIFRRATAAEQRDLGLAAGASVVVITGVDGTERIRDAYEIKLTAGDVTD